jgi:predicted O-linked N-acetylglucosamine transferase (SPINDLY family)
LGGYTYNARTNIFVCGCAPIQVNYLGYPGTMAIPCYDYIIGDSTVTPLDEAENYSEKIVILPYSYQVNDSQRTIASRVFSRAEFGLPEHGFVFCCFNNSFKILPPTFDGWMQILRQVDGSVLWLIDDNVTAAENLRRNAERQGIDSRRLVFAPRIGRTYHLARHALADLFIDSLPYNAHTTASDALWAGLPVLTLEGKSFPSRVAASLLRTLGLPELITSSQGQFEARAVQLASDPGALAAIKEKLAAAKETSPLFDTTLFARHIEAAYSVMVERARAGLPPDHIKIEP